MADTSHRDQAQRPVLPATPARQGRISGRIVWVLVVGTLLAALGLFATWMWKAPALNQAQHQQSTAQAAGSQTFNAPDPAAVIPQPGADHTAPGPAPRTP